MSDSPIEARGRLDRRRQSSVTPRFRSEVADAVSPGRGRAPGVWSLAIANILAKQKGGSLVVASSVDGDRGRTSNHVSGSAKAGPLTVVAGDGKRGLIYAPFFWRGVVAAMLAVPTLIFNRTKL